MSRLTTLDIDAAVAAGAASIRTLLTQINNMDPYAENIRRVRSIRQANVLDSRVPGFWAVALEVPNNRLFAERQLWWRWPEHTGLGQFQVVRFDAVALGLSVVAGNPQVRLVHTSRDAIHHAGRFPAASASTWRVPGRMPCASLRR